MMLNAVLPNFITVTGIAIAIAVAIADAVSYQHTESCASHCIAFRIPRCVSFNMFLFNFCHCIHVFHSDLFHCY